MGYRSFCCSGVSYAQGSAPELSRGAGARLLPGVVGGAVGCGELRPGVDVVDAAGVGLVDATQGVGLAGDPGVGAAGDGVFGDGLQGAASDSVDDRDDRW